MNRYGVRVGDASLHASTGPETVFPVGRPVGLHFPHANAIAIPELDQP